MKTIKLNILLLLFINSSLVFSQVFVKYKYNGVFKEAEYNSYEDCGCKKWAVDFYKNGQAESWGMSSNSNKEALQEEIDKKIATDHATWKEKTSDHEKYIIYCADTKLGNNYKEGREAKVNTADGMLIEEVSADPDLKKSETPKAAISDKTEKEMRAKFGKTRLLPEKNPGAVKIKFKENGGGVRGDNSKPKIEVESMAATEEKAVNVKKTPAPKKK